MQATTGHAAPYLNMTQHNNSSVRRAAAYEKLRRLVSDRSPGWLLRGTSACVHLEAEHVNRPLPGYRVVVYTEMVAKTVAFDLFNTSDNYGIRRLSRCMIGFMQNLSLKAVLKNYCNVNEFWYILNLLSERNFRQSRQREGSRSKWRDQLDVSGQRIGAD